MPKGSLTHRRQLVISPIDKIWIFADREKNEVARKVDMDSHHAFIVECVYEIEILRQDRQTNSRCTSVHNASPSSINGPIKKVANFQANESAIMKQADLLEEAPR